MLSSSSGDPDRKRPPLRNSGPSSMFDPNTFAQFIKDYGPTGVVLHFSLSAVWLGGIYVGISNGVDLTYFISEEYVGGTTSNFMVSYLGKRESLRSYMYSPFIHFFDSLPSD
jgi:hypothetical protein